MSFENFSSDDDDIEFPEQTCVCNDESLLYFEWSRPLGFHDMECIPCSGPGAVLEDKECVCTGYGEEFSEFDGDGLCECMTGNSLTYCSLITKGRVGVEITPLLCYKKGNDVICTPIPPIADECFKF